MLLKNCIRKLLYLAHEVLSLLHVGSWCPNLVPFLPFFFYLVKKLETQSIKLYDVLEHDQELVPAAEQYFASN